MGYGDWGGVYRVGNRVGIQGGYTGYPARSRLPEESPRYSGAGPGTPAGGGVGGTWDSDVTGPFVRPSLRTHPPGPVGAPAGPLPGSEPLLGQRARLRSLFHKVSQNGKVSPKSVEKACRSPHIPKRVQKVTS